MSSIEEAHEDIEAKHEKRILSACRVIGHADTDDGAWHEFVRAVLSLPGVSGDPVTRADIEQLTLSLVSKLGSVSAGQFTIPEEIKYLYGTLR